MRSVRTTYGRVPEDGQDHRRKLDWRYSVAVTPATRRATPAVRSDPGILGGTPVFVGTRVPFQTLLDYLEAGDPLSDFLDDFPTVSRELAIEALEQAKDALLARANPA